ncbi:hypothetical protein EDB81DRAFT_266331 [Dactylonectria macrodidyma]|uniref:Uncharacterized protein n=1 Tax=Dactylonectria macrodidyma TaxID=307937 RepID=A0A9P9JFC6_9HYPO|nr:hypothetical protein EDB81DRAFT_266331 [Dactylonectria macrodidyma]
MPIAKTSRCLCPLPSRHQKFPATPSSLSSIFHSSSRRVPIPAYSHTHSPSLANSPYSAVLYLFAYDHDLSFAFPIPCPPVLALSSSPPLKTLIAPSRLPGLPLVDGGGEGRAFGRLRQISISCGRRRPFRPGRVVNKTTRCENGLSVPITAPTYIVSVCVYSVIHAVHAIQAWDVAVRLSTINGWTAWLSPTLCQQIAWGLPYREPAWSSPRKVAS